MSERSINSPKNFQCYNTRALTELPFTFALRSVDDTPFRYSQLILPLEVVKRNVSFKKLCQLNWK
jgi:hypothetical protein